MQTVGEKVKFFRKRASMSQLRLEVLTMSSPGSISRIESGKINPTKETILKIAEALKLDCFDTAALFGIEINKGIKEMLGNMVLANLEREGAFC